MSASDVVAAFNDEREADSGESERAFVGDILGVLGGSQSCCENGDGEEYPREEPGESHPGRIPRGGLVAANWLFLGLVFGTFSHVLACFCHAGATYA